VTLRDGFHGTHRRVRSFISRGVTPFGQSHSIAIRFQESEPCLPV
jgi:hypothetical protein